MKFPNFLMNTSFSARAFVLLIGLFLLTTAGFAQKVPEASTTLNIEQCANGPLSAPIKCNVDDGNQGYTRGNLIPSKSHYFEGDSVPIRITSENLPLGTYTVTIGYDFTKSGKYATDYLTTYDRTETQPNDPCVGVSGCDSSSPTTFTIPLDDQVKAGFDGILGNGDDITQIPGVFTCFGCTINSVSAYSLTGSVTSDSSKNITVNFTNTSSTVVIAYGSHISTRRDWGIANSAINISGSPYHNFVAAISANFPANNGNRDLQLSADAVIFPASITIVKLVDNSDGTYSNNFQSFGFTSNIPGFATFPLMDTDAGQSQGGSITNSNIVLFGSGNALTASENADDPASGYSLSGITCTVAAGSQGGAVGSWSTTFPAGRSASVILQEGNIAVCFFTNTRVGVTAAPATVTGRVLSSTGSPLSGITLTLTDLSTGETKTATSTSFGYYTFSDLTVQDFYQLTVTSKRYRFSTPSRTFTLNSDLADMDFICTNQ